MKWFDHSYERTEYCLLQKAEALLLTTVYYGKQGKMLMRTSPWITPVEDHPFWKHVANTLHSYYIGVIAGSYLNSPSPENSDQCTQ